MSQQESLKKNKKSKNKIYAKSGSLSFLANKKRRVLTTKENVQAIECEKGQLHKLIGVQQPVAPQSKAKGQSLEEHPIKKLALEKQPREQPFEKQPLM